MPSYIYQGELYCDHMDCIGLTVRADYPADWPLHPIPDSTLDALIRLARTLDIDLQDLLSYSDDVFPKPVEQHQLPDGSECRHCGTKLCGDDEGTGPNQDE